MTIDPKSLAILRDDARRAVANGCELFFAKPATVLALVRVAEAAADHLDWFAVGKRTTREILEEALAPFRKETDRG